MSVQPVDASPHSVIKAAQSWRTNADLILDVARLGYIREEDRTLDPTYGRGKWWEKFRPNVLATHDIAMDGVDFRDLPYESNWFDAVAFDPPYVSVGGRVTTTLPDFQDRYGLTDAPTSPASLQVMINDGLTEIKRVIKPSTSKRKHHILVKCTDYVSSGKLWIGTHWTLDHALAIGLECVDRFEHIGNVRAQPAGRRQVHARRNLSTLFVFEKPLNEGEL